MKFRGKVLGWESSSGWKADVVRIEVPSNLFIPEQEYEVTLERVGPIEFEAELFQWEGGLNIEAELASGILNGRYKVLLTPCD